MGPRTRLHGGFHDGKSRAGPLQQFPGASQPSVTVQLFRLAEFFAGVLFLTGNIESRLERAGKLSVASQRDVEIVEIPGDVVKLASRPGDIAVLQRRPGVVHDDLSET